MRLAAFFLLTLALAGAVSAEPMLVRVGGADIDVEVLGDSGSVVVFESGLGEGMRGWGEVARAVSRCARVVLYDRPGIGRSGPRREAIVPAGAVADGLAALLRALKLPPPYVLVGHSLGGLYVQAFARTFPGETAGVVLVDAASPLEPPGVFVSSVPPRPGSVEAAEEAGVLPSMAALLDGPPFPPVPLVVLAATDHGDSPDREKLWREVQAGTAALSPSGRLIVAENSGHFIQTDRPALVVESVLDVLSATGADASACRDGASMPLGPVPPPAAPAE